ncbi:isochorismate synthase [Psychromonas antarctica]|jgi:menaquinone-specific isochorismate synthase|uniref:isochorismate synthase n=1 Tax=Psychromonas antarctica TaxID=67573 RepID=UPI001EE8CD2F|nr:isochorismate synthase [Psychromonas antarctica]MCG6200133.1 isochorismate synthase [Psychromonas antarctica]
MINLINKQLQQFAQTAGDKPRTNLVIHLAAVNLLALLKGQSLGKDPIYPAIYWQDKEQQQTIACLGQIEECTNIPQPTAQACYFGGLAFQQQGEQWLDFPAIRFIRPALEFKLQQQKLTLTCHFNGLHRIDKTIALVNMLQPPQALTAVETTILSRSDLPNQAQWADLVDLAIEYKALLPKVVLSRETQLLCKNRVNHLDLLAQWQQANPNSFHFSVQFSQKHAFISCSPERLFCRKKSQLKTEALAGTINRGRTEREDAFLSQSLLTDKKIDRENYLVQEFIIANLKQLKAKISCEDAYVMQLQNVQHLCVPINATLNAQTTDANLLYKLHPTPAVGGSPKLPALQFINDKEPYLRGWYAGAVGYLSSEKSDFSVAIRSALMTDHSIKLFAGAGIVTGSIAAQEWQELDNKIGTVLDILSAQKGVR